MKSVLCRRNCKQVGVVILVLTVITCFPNLISASPAYSQTNYNSVRQSPSDNVMSSPTRSSDANSNGGRRTLQSVVQHHMDELDKQTQSDLKILSYLEKELNQIFSCYILLSCPRTRSAKVLAECDTIKEWPLYHQVMKMAGIRKYPYQNYAPRYQSVPATTTTTTTVPTLTEGGSQPSSFSNRRLRSGVRHDRVNESYFAGNSVTNNNNDDEDDETETNFQRDARHRPRRNRRVQKSQQTLNENDIEE